MTLEQKRIELECHNRRQGAPSRVQLEFGRTAIRQLEENIPVVAKPSVAKVSIFLSNTASILPVLVAVEDGHLGHRRFGHHGDVLLSLADRCATELLLDTRGSTLPTIVALELDSFLFKSHTFHYRRISIDY